MELIFISLISKYSLFHFLCEWAWYVWIVCMYICASESPYMSVWICFYAYFVEGEGKTLSVGPPPLPWLKQSLTVQCKFLGFFCLHLQSYQGSRELQLHMLWIGFGDHNPIPHSSVSSTLSMEWSPKTLVSHLSCPGSTLYTSTTSSFLVSTDFKKKNLLLVYN